MALPKLDIPTFELTLPSSDKKVKYRPFLVKEQKLLMMLQNADKDEIDRIVEELVNTCTFETLDVKNLPSVDIEYLFLNIRARSISEVFEFIINCDCGTQIDAEANIDEIKIEKSVQHTSKILVTDNLGFEFKYPHFREVFSVYADQSIDNIFNLVLSCIKAVYTPEEYVEVDESNREELKEMLEKLTKAQFEKLEEFFVTMPKLIQHVKKTCPACGAENEVQIKGLDNFFV